MRSGIKRTWEEVDAAIEDRGVSRLILTKSNSLGQQRSALRTFTVTKPATLMFISLNYKKKYWTNHERQAAQSRAFEEKSEYILPARFDDTEIPGLLPTIQCIDLRIHTPEELALLVCKSSANLRLI
ncbi:MAG: TIR domain-containing protein [Nitrosomonas sp.]|nr:TIR domain-containing protein [Nitrosomonas sp.]